MNFPRLVTPEPDQCSIMISDIIVLDCRIMKHILCYKRSRVKAFYGILFTVSFLVLLITIIDQQKQEYVSDGVEYVPSLQKVYSPVFTDPRLVTSSTSSSVPIAGIMVGLGSLAGAGRQMVSLLELSGADTLDLVIITSGDSVAGVARFIGDIIAKQVTQRVVCQDGYSSFIISLVLWNVKQIK